MATKIIEKLDRIEFPLEAQVLLVGRYDTDGSKAGVAAPEAVGAVEIEWLLRDPPEDTAGLPVSTADIPSHGKAYIDKVLQSTAGNAGDAQDAKDNAPTNNNGVRGTAADHYRAGNLLPPFTSRAAGGRTFSKTHDDKTADAQNLGRSGIIFQGSIIAGDSWALQARVAFETEANKATLKSLHESFHGKPFEQILAAETGTMTLWRRRHVACVIDWPAPTMEIDWKEVEDAYKMAHIELDTQHARLTIEQLLPTEADKNEYLDLVVAHTRMAKDKLKFDSQCMYPADLPPQGNTENADVYSSSINELVSAFIKSDKDKLARLLEEHRKGTKSKVTADEKADYKFLIAFGNWIRQRVKKIYGPGMVIVRANFCRPVTPHDQLLVFGRFTQLPRKPFVPKITCIGLPGGVSLISNPMGDEEQDGFLIAHEMGHCYYLSHHEIDGKGTAQVPKDHDTNDKNCTMSYPWGIKSRLGLKWERGAKTEPRFCGKCILKLRGWKVADAGLPETH